MTAVILHRPFSRLAIVAAIAALVIPPVGVALGIVAATRCARPEGSRGMWLAVTAIVVGAVLTLLTGLGVASWLSLAGSFHV